MRAPCQPACPEEMPVDRSAVQAREHAHACKGTPDYMLLQTRL